MVGNTIRRFVLRDGDALPRNEKGILLIKDDNVVHSEIVFGTYGDSELHVWAKVYDEKADQ